MMNESGEERNLIREGPESRNIAWIGGLYQGFEKCQSFAKLIVELFATASSIIVTQNILQRCTYIFALLKKKLLRIHLRRSFSASYSETKKRRAFAKSSLPLKSSATWAEAN